MDKKIAGLLGAVGALASINGAQAISPSDPNEVLKAQSFTDLLEPIPNALQKLQAIDEASISSPRVRMAQFYVEHHHHHHHHHHGYYRRYGPRIVIPGYDYGYGAYGYRRYEHHHHHHHHHHGYFRRYEEDDD